MPRKLKVDWRHDEETLYEAYKQETDHQYRTRLHALWLVRCGHTATKTAEVVGVHRSSIRQWLDWYEEGGIEEVRDHRHGGSGGQTSRLTEEQEAALLDYAAEGNIHTIWDGVEWVQSEFGVEYTYWGMRHVFERLELRKKVPRPQSPEADPEAQEAWKKGA